MTTPTDTNQVLPSIILLPSPTMPLITKDMKIERAWYLCLRQIIAQIGGFAPPPLSVTDLQALTDENLDISTVDIASLPALLQSLQISELDYDLSEAPSRQDVSDALLLANAALDNSDAALTGLASPSAKVGLNPVAGSAITGMRSDGAPPIDQTIAPTWTGLHTFAKSVTLNAPPTAIPALTATGEATANIPAVQVNGSATSGSSCGIFILAGAVTADRALDVLNQAGTTRLFGVFGDGTILLGNVPFTATAPAAGGAGALPATPAGYMTITINGTARKLAYY